MSRARIEVPQLENMVGAGKKKFVRYAEGASKIEQYVMPFEGQGLRYEIQVFVQYASGKLEKPMMMNTEESVAAAEILGAFLRQRNGKYEVNKSE